MDKCFICTILTFVVLLVLDIFFIYETVHYGIIEKDAYKEADKCLIESNCKEKQCFGKKCFYTHDLSSEFQYFCEIKTKECRSMVQMLSVAFGAPAGILFIILFVFYIPMCCCGENSMFMIHYNLMKTKRKQKQKQNQSENQLQQKQEQKDIQLEPQQTELVIIV